MYVFFGHGKTRLFQPVSRNTLLKNSSRDLGSITLLRLHVNEKMGDELLPPLLSESIHYPINQLGWNLFQSFVPTRRVPFCAWNRVTRLRSKTQQVKGNVGSRLRLHCFVLKGCRMLGCGWCCFAVSRILRCRPSHSPGKTRRCWSIS